MAMRMILGMTCFSGVEDLSFSFSWGREFSTSLRLWACRNAVSCQMVRTTASMTFYFGVVHVLWSTCGIYCFRIFSLAVTLMEVLRFVMSLRQTSIFILGCMKPLSISWSKGLVLIGLVRPVLIISSASLVIRAELIASIVILLISWRVILCSRITTWISLNDIQSQSFVHFFWWNYSFFPPLHFEFQLF